ncbi:GGDEF domain-containing protein [Deinococcus sp.]|uniref:GGDEF domain-containing protein n=1 Tax=Deinococcus sp. TaxID=47478 RepID=UPI003C79F6A0
MASASRFLDQLLLNLVRASSRQELLDQLLIRVLGLRSITLWWKDDGILTSICRVGDPRDEGAARPLPSEPRYLLSWTPGVGLSDEALAVLGLRLVYLDAQQAIAALSEQRAALERAARTDTLTGLLNRRAFDTDLDAIDAAGTPFAVVLIDLDGFKRVNDTYGHAVGDSLLRGYGAWLTRMTGAWGRAYRMGGDEYLILVTSFPGNDPEFSAWAHERLQVPFVDGVSASIGVAWRHESWRVSDVVRLADQRMYHAKNARADAQGGPKQV